MYRGRGVRCLLALALAAGTVGFAACGDDDDDASDAVESAQSQAASIQSQVGEQVDSAQSQAGEIQSQVGEQVESALSQASSAASEATAEEPATSEASEATSEAGSESAAARRRRQPRARRSSTSAGCGGCHTLADAGASGAVGPNLDDLKPDAATVAAQVENGGGGMPAFGASCPPRTSRTSPRT